MSAAKPRRRVQVIHDQAVGLLAQLREIAIAANPGEQTTALRALAVLATLAKAEREVARAGAEVRQANYESGPVGVPVRVRDKD